MKTHTKGPWMYAMQKDEIRIFHVAYGAICNIPHNGKYTQEHEANAQLIARAPELLEENESLKSINKELLEALEEIYRTLSSDDTQICQILPEHDSFYKPDIWLRKVKDLIAKAKL